MPLTVIRYTSKYTWIRNLSSPPQKYPYYKANIWGYHSPNPSVAADALYLFSPSREDEPSFEQLGEVRRSETSHRIPAKCSTVSVRSASRIITLRDIVERAGERT